MNQEDVTIVQENQEIEPTPYHPFEVRSEFIVARKRFNEEGDRSSST